jgi:hypothetical protein
MPFFYRSGEPIELGDRVRLHGAPAEIESLHDPVEDPDDWFVKRYGGGVIIAEPQVFGHLFVNAPVADYEDLEFVSRSL